MSNSQWHDDQATGERALPPDVVAKLAEVLGLEIADLLPRIQPDLGANQ